MRVERFDPSGPVTLAVRIPAGKVDFVTRSDPGVVVELEGSSSEAEAAVRIELRDHGSRSEVVVEAPRRFLGREDYELRITTPAGTAVEARTASADVECRGAIGELDLETASGDLTAQEVGGSLKVKSASGDVLVQAVAGGASVHTASGDVLVKSLGGEGTIRSASGDVSLGRTAAGLTIQTASGDQTVGSVAAGTVTLQSASGDIEVGVAPGTRVYVDARSASGEMESELDLGEEPVESGGPLVELRATTMSGDVRVVRAGPVSDTVS